MLDFSGYVKATNNNIELGSFVHSTWHKIDDGQAWIVLNHWIIKNNGATDLTEAICVVKTLFLEYYNESGHKITVTDPVELAKLLRLQNSEETWNGGYVTWLGTIKPGHSRRLITNFWIGVGNWSRFGYQEEVWYRAN